MGGGAVQRGEKQMGRAFGKGGVSGRGQPWEHISFVDVRCTAYNKNPDNNTQTAAKGERRHGARQGKKKGMGVSRPITTISSRAALGERELSGQLTVKGGRTRDGEIVAAQGRKEMEQGALEVRAEHVQLDTHWRRRKLFYVGSPLTPWPESCPNRAPMYPNPPILHLPNPISYIETPCALAKLME